MGIGTDIREACKDLDKINPQNQEINEPDLTTVFGLSLAIKKLTAEIEMILEHLDTTG